jgi:predicted DNA-binding antitoxin AbrB/MazE fold protein
MSKQIDVIYTHGVFRPLEPLELGLEEGQRLILILPESSDEREAFIEDEGLRKWCAKQAGGQVPNTQAFPGVWFARRDEIAT